MTPRTHARFPAHPFAIAALAVALAACTQSPTPPPAAPQEQDPAAAARWLIEHQHGTKP